MGKRYKKSPLVEALCEFQFDQDSVWDFTLPGLIEEKEKAAIQGFLRRHPFLVQILLDASDKIDSYFNEAQVFLNLAIDYEAADNYAKEVDTDEELAVSIATSMPPREAIEQL